MACAAVIALTGCDGTRGEAVPAHDPGMADGRAQRGSSQSGADEAGSADPGAAMPFLGDGSTLTARLSPTEHLTRASMALRGVRPGAAELEAVRDDPERLLAIVDYYLTTDAFGQTVREIHEQALLIGVDGIVFPAGFVPRDGLADLSSYELNRSITQAALRLIEHVVMSGRPYGEIVTADYTLADRAVATVWGLPYDEDRAARGETWQQTHYLDGRPTSGILSDSFLFTRHTTTLSNKGRGRANAISRALLCYDFLSRSIPLDASIDLADPDAVADAVRNNPACVSCHQTLDPLAAFFAGYRPIYVPTQQTTYPVAFMREALRPLLQTSEPNYFGIVGGDIRVLGEMITQDPRFSACAARRFYGYLAQIDPQAVPHPHASELQGVLIDSGMDARQLAKAVVLSEAFTSASEADPKSADRGLLRVRPRQLARSIEELTGYRWRARLEADVGTGRVGDVDLMSDAFFGFKVLAGGIDSQHVTRPSHTMTATASLTVENLAARAAAHVVQKDRLIEEPERRWLLTEVAPDETEERSVRAQLARLQLLLYGQFADPDDPSVNDAYTLFAGVLEGDAGDPQRAWTTTLYAMFQDPRFLFY